MSIKVFDLSNPVEEKNCKEWREACTKKGVYTELKWQHDSVFKVVPAINTLMSR